MEKTLLLSVFGAFLLTSPVSSHDVAAWSSFTSDHVAHSGGTDRKGCHWDRKKDVYHCH